MRIVVTGGTGFVGTALVDSLLGRGDEVIILTRGKAKPPAPSQGGTLEHRPWTPEEAGEWQNVVDGADAVVHLAGAGVMDERWTPERKALIRSSRVVSTELLAKAIAGAKKKPDVLVSGSAVGFYGMREDDTTLTEEDPNGSDFLAELVRDWEKAAAPARDAGVRVCYPRIGIVLGKEGGALKEMLPPFRAFVGGPVGAGTQWMAWIHLRDTVRAIEAMIDRKDLEGIYNVSAPEPVTSNEFAKTIGKVLKRPSFMRVPAFALKLALGESAAVLLTGQRAIPRKLVDAGFEFVFPDLTSAIEDLVS